MPVSAITDATLSVDAYQPGIEKGTKMPYILITSDTKKRYASPQAFRNKVSDNKILEHINHVVRDNMKEFKRAWVKLGTSIMLVKLTGSYKITKNKTFEDFCKNELNLHRATVYEIIASTFFLIEEKRDLYDSLISGEIDDDQYLPSYHSVYLLSKNRKKLKEKYVDILDNVFKGKCSTAELQELLRGEKKSPLDIFAKEVNGLSKKIEGCSIEEKVKKEINCMLLKIKEMISKIE